MFKTKPVPFEITNLNHGFQKATGLIKLEGEQILCEFRVVDAILGMIKSDVKETRIPLSDLHSVEFKKGFFRSKMIFEAQSLRVFEHVPGSEQGEWEIRIKRKDRDDARDLVSKIRLALSEMRLRDLDT